MLPASWQQIGLTIRAWAIRVEEQELERSVGNAYTEYARSRRRLIPGVW